MDAVTQAEQMLKSTAAELTAPREAECLYHYLCRMLDQHGCHAPKAWPSWSARTRSRGESERQCTRFRHARLWTLVPLWTTERIRRGSRPPCFP